MRAHKDIKLGLRNESVNSKLAYMWLFYFPIFSFILTYFKDIVRSLLIYVNSRQYYGFFCDKGKQVDPRKVIS